MLKSLRIGIVGVGMVGGTLKRYFEKQGTKPFIYDKGKNLGSIEEVNQAEIIFICVPTPYNKEKGFDLSFVEDAISKIQGKKIIVIKSTVLPGTTEFLQKKYRHHRFLFNPEFLTETTAWKDFSRPIFQIIGFTSKSKNLAKKILKILPKGKTQAILPSTVAEVFKYARNCFFASKVIFANQIYDLCKKLKINYKDIKKLMSSDPWIGKNHLEIFHKGYRGFGGKCLPKDLKAFISFYKKINLKPELFEVVDKINSNLLKSQKLFKKLNQDWLNNKN